MFNKIVNASQAASVRNLAIGIGFIFLAGIICLFAASALSNSGGPSAALSAFITLATSIAWPILIFWIWHHHKEEIRQILPRLRRFSPTGAEFDSAEQQAEGEKLESPDASGALKKVPEHRLRTSLMIIKSSIERDLYNFPENERETKLLIALSEARLFLHFERVYRLIFGSQIEGLNYLRKNFKATISEATAFYDEKRSLYPDFYDNFSFEKWIGFLEDNNLIHNNDGIITLTDIGLDFLIYVTESRLNDAKPG